MVCLTSCVFRSIRFSGFARPHVGVRREGELYTRLQAGGKGGRERTRDAHKSGKNFFRPLSRPERREPRTGQSLEAGACICAHPAGSHLFQLARKGRSGTCYPEISRGTARSPESRMVTQTPILKA